MRLILVITFFSSVTVYAQAPGGGGQGCKGPDMPKCITFSAEGKNPPATCPNDQAMHGYTVDDGQPPNAKHIFAYTHGFCGPTGSANHVDAGEAAWCKKVASQCQKNPGLTADTYSKDWNGKKGAECLIEYVAKTVPDGAHFEIDNCSQYKSGGVVQCYTDLLAAMKAANIGNRRLVLKNLMPEEARQLKKVFDEGNEDSKHVSNFVIVEEEFDKNQVQQILNGSCASVAQSKDTTKYGVNENHVESGGGGGPILGQTIGSREPSSSGSR